MRSFPNPLRSLGWGLFTFLGLFLGIFCLLQAEQADPNGALSMSGQVYKVTPNEVLVHAQTVIDRKEYLLAEEMLKELLNKPGVIRPVLAQATMMLGRIAQASKRPSEAIVWFRRYLDTYPDQSEAPYVNFLLGQTYKEMGSYERARENFYKTLSFAVSKASSLSTEDFGASVRLSQAAEWELSESEYLANNWAKAEDLYERFKNQNPQLEMLSSSANYRMADCSYQQGKTAEAILRYESALANAPFHPFAAEAWLRLISLYGQLNDTKKQIEATHCFIWLVNTLQEPDKLYWQRRCADLLLSEYRDTPEKQIPVLETIASFDKSESWVKMLDFYLSLVDRQVPAVASSDSKTPSPSDKARDDWQTWLKGFNMRLDELHKKLDQVRVKESTPPAPTMTAPAMGVMTPGK